MQNDVLIAIPARGGSKRLPRKNIALLAGKPMIVYSIEAALASKLTEHVYVCTEDEEIASISKIYGAKVFSITPEMADDEVSSTVPCMALYESLKSQGVCINYIFNLQPTSPLRNSLDIIDSFESFKTSNRDFLISTTPIDPHYFHWAMIDRESTWEMYFGKDFLKERTQLPPVYRPNGAIKLAKAESLARTGNYFGYPLAVYMMPEERSIHVATDFDLKCSEAIIQSYGRKQ
ncbi:MAG: acylneuraminate cytidylyltransferase family protein [Geobacteraceae bacterium]|nr:acylneuraminate cytidylyltransferase family protein [Geobacteraceae bacterium]